MGERIIVKYVVMIVNTLAIGAFLAMIVLALFPNLLTKVLNIVIGGMQ